METDWKRQLRREASGHGMCKENRAALDSLQDKGEAIELYKKTIDWALEENYPSFATIQRDFSGCEDFGIFVDKEFHGEILTDQQVYVFHHCKGTIRVGLNTDKQIIPMLYFANGCEMSLKPTGPANLEVRVPLYIFGRNLVKLEASENVVFRTYKFDVK
ncbi:MAG: hypothetical protein J6T35_02600 [Bacteroidales bacterium]|nr:hypothetical protein [Bacteroidales bacterium]